MMWQLQALLAYLTGPEGSNLIFALLCLWAATGRRLGTCAILSALVYLGLAFI